jgi:hypothetical protein
MVRALGEASNTNTILLPHSPSSVGDIMSQIRDGILIADAATESNARPRAIPAGSLIRKPLPADRAIQDSSGADRSWGASSRVCAVPAPSAGCPQQSDRL